MILKHNHFTLAIVFRWALTFYITTSNFTSNIGNSIHLFLYNTVFESILFINNTASNGAAIYVDQESTVAVATGAVLHFTNNIFAGATFDYFGNSAEPSMECVDCAGSVELNLGHMYISIDNSSDIHVKFFW